MQHSAVWMVTKAAAKVAARSMESLGVAGDEVHGVALDSSHVKVLW